MCIYICIYTYVVANHQPSTFYNVSTDGIRKGGRFSTRQSGDFVSKFHSCSRCVHFATCHGPNFLFPRFLGFLVSGSLGFSVIYGACNSENFKGDCESPTVSALRLLDMDSCRDFVSFFSHFLNIDM